MAKINRRPPLLEIISTLKVMEKKIKNDANYSRDELIAFGWAIKFTQYGFDLVKTAKEKVMNASSN